MEAFLHRLFTAKSDFPVWVRYLLTLGLVGLAFFARVMADEYLRSYPLLLFIPAIFLSSVLFGRGCGIVATAAAAVLAMTYLIPRPASTAGGRSAPGARTSNAGTTSPLSYRFSGCRPAPKPTRACRGRLRPR
jgi:hypothetical protein